MGRESFPEPSAGPDPCLLLQHRLDRQTALARFAERALRATAAEPLRAEASALLDEALVVDDDEVAFAESVGRMLEAASGRLRAMEVSRQAALHDPLTGLANRSLILDRLHLALARAKRRASLVAVIFLDLDGFKQVNDSLGHAAGDEFLVEMAERLRPVVRPADTLGRWGGDEFVVVCEDLEQSSAVSAIVERVASVFGSAFEIQGRPLRVTASIGVAVSGGDDDQPAALIHAADSEMYRAKQHRPTDGWTGGEAPALSGGAGQPKLERVTARLLDLLAGLAVDEPDTHHQDAPVGPFAS